jgi:hypothetical protein
LTSDKPAESPLAALNFVGQEQVDYCEQTTMRYAGWTVPLGACGARGESLVQPGALDDSWARRLGPSSVRTSRVFASHEQEISTNSI